MKKSILLMVCSLAMGSAYAGNDRDDDCRGNCGSTGGNTYNNPTANGGHGGNGYGGTGVGQGGNASATGGNASASGGSVIGSGNSNTSVRNDINTDIDASTRSNAAASVASLNSNDSKAASKGNTTSVSIGGDTYERSAPAVFAGNIPSVARSCRLYMFGGGSNVTGAVSGSIPLGNDQTCLSGAKVDYMTAANRLFPGAFSQASFVQTICEVEGMDAVAECQQK